MLENLLADFSDPFPVLAWETALMRLGIAILLGGLIGFEREVHDKPAGLRTNMLVSLAACLFAILAFELVAMSPGHDGSLAADPLRLVEAVTAGVAFLAAGSIITAGGSVKGLTTGAGMWMAGAVGLAVGIGEVLLAGIATAVALVVLWIFRMMEP